LFSDTDKLTLRHEWPDISRWVERIPEFFREESI
jgi:hypothetical protein